MTVPAKGFRMALSEAFAAWGLPGAVDEFEGAVPGRKFRLDVAWEKQKVAVEQMGGVWTRGKHGRGSGIVKDQERRNLLQLEGWIVLEYTPQQLWGGYATDEIKKALMMRGWKNAIKKGIKQGNRIE